ncbi:WD40 repeat-containing protein, putative [Bodo saltans]|uniref:WD40 repeat-containing protein, putative n=1 Tax=Bodo saltans TaxID=75058 RepID=A0A0S4IPM9_BODSA|nr:WD40 repeat-containing protein, putative [Bodo saltans]|eukprot:CUF10887.1 WD40 repeat-containing protein, putative [Bodo saltans]
MGENIAQYTADPYVVSKITFPELGEHCYAVKVSPCGKFVACTFGNGVVRILDANTYEPLQRNKLGSPYDDLPSTCVKWGARTESGEYTLVSTSAAGVVFGWVWDGSSFAERVFRLPEDKNDTAALDFSPDGKHFVTGGSDRSIRVYSFDEKKVSQVMVKGVDAEGHSRVAHNNRIFSVRYVSPTAVVSGGWESPVQVWDLRTGRSERQVSGSQIGADSIEPIVGTTRFITASNRSTQQIQVFDYVTCREIEEDSLRLTAACGKTQLSGVRYCAHTKSIWVICLKPHTVMQVDYASGKVLGIVECKVPVMGLDVSDHHPGKVFIACMNEAVIVVEGRAQ